MNGLRRHPILHLLGVLLALATLLPLVWIFVRAGQSEPHRVLGILRDPQTAAMVVRSLGLSVLVACLCGALALPLAWLTHATDVPGRALWQRLLVLPLAVPSYISGFVVLALLGPSGWVAQATGMALPHAGGWTATTAALLFAYPYALLPVQAAMTRLDPRTFEAARSLGCSPAAAFWRVVFPAVLPAWVGGMLLVALYVLSDFGAVSLMRFPSLSYVIYLRYSSPFGRADAVVYGAILAALALLLLVIARRIPGADPTAHQTMRRPWPSVALGVWRWPAAALCASVAAGFAALPVVVVSWWLIRGLRNGNSLIDLRVETAWTLGLGTAAAVLIVGLGLVPVLLARFGNPGVSRFVDRATHAGYALPGIVVALALVYFANRVVPVLYHTVWLLLFAYVVRFLPQATTALRDGVHPGTIRLFEAARSLGARPTRAVWRVVLPVAAPAIAAALLAVFLSTIKELPATLLLRPPGVSTLAQRVWSLTQDAFFTAASPTVLLLLLLAFGALALRPDSRQGPPSDPPSSR